MKIEKNKFEQWLDDFYNHPIGWKIGVILFVVGGFFAIIKAVDETISICKKYTTSESIAPKVEQPIYNPQIDTISISPSTNSEGGINEENGGMPSSSSSSIKARDKSIEFVSSLEKRINNCLNSNNKFELGEIMKNNFSEGYICYVREEFFIYEKRINFFRLIVKKQSIKIDSVKTDRNNLIKTIWLKTL